MIARQLQTKLLQLATKFPFVLVTGPRQSGKSTLVKASFPHYQYVSFADIDIREFARQDPRGFIATFNDHVIIDEVQKEPSILSYLQTHTDNAGREGMYILTGSQNMLMMDSVDQTLAGRVGILRLLPLSHAELDNARMLPPTINDEIFQGGYPRLYDKNIDPVDYYPSYTNTYVERDVRQLKDVTNLSLFIKLIKLCAGRIGQLLNKSSLAVECGVSAPTINAWLTLLEQSYIIYLLKPSYKNFCKRIVKSPKLYFYDTGLACSLLEISDASQIAYHYLRGALFENMVINELMKSQLNQGRQPNLSFWRDSSGNEIDLIRSEGNDDFAYEIKSGATPTADYFKGLNYWRSLSHASTDNCSVIYGGTSQRLTSHGRLIPWNNLKTL